MSEIDTDGPYWCPLCQVPAPSVAACKIHISRSDDAIHTGYTGADLHEEIVTRQTIEDPGVSQSGVLQARGEGLISTIRAMITALRTGMR